MINVNRIGAHGLLLMLAGKAFSPQANAPLVVLAAFLLIKICIRNSVSKNWFTLNQFRFMHDTYTVHSPT
jgi:hypothetical protein